MLQNCLLKHTRIPTLRKPSWSKVVALGSLIGGRQSWCAATLRLKTNGSGGQMMNFREHLFFSFFRRAVVIRKGLSTTHERALARYLRLRSYCRPDMPRAPGRHWRGLPEGNRSAQYVDCVRCFPSGDAKSVALDYRFFQDDPLHIPNNILPSVQTSSDY